MCYVGVPPDMKAKIVVACTHDDVSSELQETEGVQEVSPFKNQVRIVDFENLFSEECKNRHLCNA